MRVKRFFAGVALLALVGLAIQPANAQERAKVRISQAFQSLLYLSLYTAYDVGFFEEEGLDVTVSTGGGGSQSWAAVLGGSADYSIQDPVFPSISREKGGPGVVVGTVCNAETIYALAKNPDIKLTDDPKAFLSHGYKIATQPEPDSAWARLKYMAKQLGIEPGPTTYTNVQVPIGSEMGAVYADQADIGMSYPPVVELAEAKGLHIVFSITEATRPHLFSSLNTTRDFIEKNPDVNQRVMNAFEKASQYIYAFPEEAVKIGMKEFPDLPPEVVRKAVERMIAELAYPEHAYAEYNAWMSDQNLHKFVGTIKEVPGVADGLDNTAALAAYRKFGRIHWDGPRPITRSVSQ